MEQEGMRGRTICEHMKMIYLIVVSADLQEGVVCDMEG